LKNIGLIFFLFCLTSNLFGQTQITHLVDLVKEVDNTWTLKIDTSTKAQKGLIFGGQCVGFMIFTKGKQVITYCVYQSLSNNFDSSIHHTQKLASCSIIGLTEKNQIAKQKDLIIFLSIYPCWSEYSEEAKKLIQKTFTKLRSQLVDISNSINAVLNGSTAANIGIAARLVETLSELHLF
jgi:hypothetical protein